MKKLYIIILSSIVILSIIFAFKAPGTATTKNYEHLFIISEGIELQKVFISINGKDYSYQNRLKKESQGDWDVNPLINLVHQYEAEGWELQAFNQNGVHCNCWLRRPAR